MTTSTLGPAWRESAQGVASAAAPAARTGLIQHARLMTEARSMVLEGWPIAAASWWSAAESRYRCGRNACPRTDCHLVDFTADPDAAVACDAVPETAVLTDSQTASERWARNPYAPVLVIGHGIAVIDVPAALAEIAATGARGASWPLVVAAHDEKRSLYFAQPPNTDPAGALRVLADHGIRHREAGTWVLLPPAALPSGTARWIQPPEAARWELPPFAAVVHALSLAAASPAAIVRGNGHQTIPPPPSGSRPDGI